jgi:putative IMPACT (imprinted ancient) family translation regulator
VVVVTRWFGGVLLGAGGLVRAYSDAVRAGLDEAGVRQRLLLDRYALDVPHADAGRLEHALRAAGVVVLGVDYGDAAQLHLAVPADEAERVPRLLAELSGGEWVPEPAGSGWVDA